MLGVGMFGVDLSRRASESLPPAFSLEQFIHDQIAGAFTRAEMDYMMRGSGSVPPVGIVSA